MPWKEFPMHEQRSAFVHLVRSLYYSVSQAAREFGISRKTAHKWLARYKEDPDIPLLDRSRRPSRSPARSDAVLEQKTLEVRKQFGWGPRKIRAYLINQKLHEGPLPSVRTFANILSRSGCIHPQSSDPSPSQRFERPEPNELWQVDHKGPVEVERQKVMPLTVLDDHSR